MDATHTLSGIVSQAGCQFQVFDLGRRVQPVDNTTFMAVEANQAPYPYPIQQHAVFAFAYWKEVSSPWIWFLKFPLDERGLLKQAAVGDFIRYIAEALGAVDNPEDPEDRGEMPYTYTPPDSKMAMFHALFAAQHGQQASRYYEHTQHYLSGNLEWDNWQGVGIQGIADVCSRLKSDNNTTVLRRALTHLPSEPFDAFMECLEHTELPDSLANRLAELLNDNIPATDRDVTLIRALAGANQRIQVEAISSWLANTVSEDGLVAIAGRCWNALSEPALLEPYLLTLARNGNQPLFNAIFRDLVQIPSLRMYLLPVLHGQCSPALSNALLALQSTVKES
ncbi:DUF3549 family protein [Parasalinivibrio latis]|uniref:DUF3549 family protein n=1 Tax=Parasalinivibrio latis TaxID=2952610 RepID=UPI0030E00E0E